MPDTNSDIVSCSFYPKILRSFKFLQNTDVMDCVKVPS